MHPAARLVTFLRTHQHDRIVEPGGLPADQALRAGGGRAAHRADGREFLDGLGAGQQFGDETERLGPEIQVQARQDHAHARIRQFQDQRHQRRVHELHLVDPDHVRQVRAARRQQRALAAQVRAYLGRAAHRHRADAAARVTGHGGLVVPVVQGGFEHLHVLPRDHRAGQAADQFLALATEHRSDDDFQVTAVIGGLQHAREHRALP